MKESQYAYLYVVQVSEAIKIYTTLNSDGDIKNIIDANPSPVSIVLAVRYDSLESAKMAKLYLTLPFEKFHIHFDWYAVHPQFVLDMVLKPIKDTDHA